MNKDKIDSKSDLREEVKALILDLSDEQVAKVLDDIMSLTS